MIASFPPRYCQYCVQSDLYGACYCHRAFCPPAYVPEYYNSPPSVELEKLRRENELLKEMLLSKVYPPAWKNAFRGKRWGVTGIASKPVKRLCFFNRGERK